MNPITIRNVVIGEGIPKICVPIVGETREEILKQANTIAGLPADIVEWRGDWFEDILHVEKVNEILGQIRNILGEKLILFTFRRAEEGGEKQIQSEEYLYLNRSVAASGLADIVDIELFSGEALVRTFVNFAHEQGVKVIASNHDFEKTPAKEEIINRLKQMQELGADILKMAVMPQSKKDVITLLDATEEMVRLYAERPVVTMAMSGMGSISRIAGEVFGSAITFGSAARASAPGQMEVEKLRDTLNILHQSLR